MDHGKLERLLPILLLLSGQRRYSAEELAARFDTSERTIRRYLKTFRESGFVIQCTGGRYNLQTSVPAYKSLQGLIHFDDDEACILYQTLDGIEGSSPVKERLLRKLNVLYDFHILQRQSLDALTMIRQLRKAMSGRRQVRLVSYRSSSSGTVGDRLVEAFAFLPEYEAVWAIEAATGSCKQFRLSRIGRVEDTAQVWVYEQRHCVPYCDAFRMAAEAPVGRVRARLSLKAYNLLVEEYPQARDYLSTDGERYLLDIPVASYAGVGRFVLGLANEIDIKGDNGMLDYLDAARQETFKSDSDD